MIAVLKLIFDLSFYYALSSVYLNIFAEQRPLVRGVFLLVLIFAAYILLQSSSAAVRLVKTGEASRPRLLTIVFCVLPAFYFLFGPSLPQLIQFVPAWGYLVYCLCAGKIGTNRAEFGVSFRKVAKLYIIAVPGLLFLSRIAGTLSSALPYFMVWFAAAICLKRVLRYEGSIKRGRGVAVIAAVIAICALLSFVLTEQIFSNALGWFFNNVVYYVIYALIFAFSWLFLGLSRVFQMLVSWLRNEPAGAPLGGEGAFYGELYGYEPPAWFELGIFAMLIIGAAVAVWFLANLIRAARTGRAKRGPISEVYFEQSEWIKESAEGEKVKVLRPRNPRQAIRWYYRRYLLKGASKGANLEDSDTSLSVLVKFGSFFNESEERAFRELYLKARYWQGIEISKADAEDAARLWRKMKR